MDALVADDMAVVVPHGRIREAIFLVIIFLRVALVEKARGRITALMGGLRVAPARISSGTKCFKVRGSMAGARDCWGHSRQGAGVLGVTG